MIRKRILTILQFMLFMGLGVFLVWWMLKGITKEQWQILRESLTHARFWLLIPVFALLFLSHYLRALRWKMLMEPMGYKPSIFHVFNAVMIGYLANMAFPRLGEVLKCTLLARYEKVAPDKLIGTIVAERAVDVVSLLIVFAATFLFQADKIGGYGVQKLKENFGDKIQLFQGRQLFITIGVTIAFLFLLYFLFRWLKKSPVIKKVRSFGQGIIAGLFSIRKMERKGLFILHSILIWVLYLACTRLGFYALSETSDLGIKEALSVLSFGSIGMIATPGGLGAYHLIVQQTLELYGLQEIYAIGTSWILWSAQTAVVLIGGLACFLVLAFVKRKSNEINSTYS